MSAKHPPAREDWLDSDFDIPDGVQLRPPSTKDNDDEDWDSEMNFGQTGGAKVQAVVAGIVARSGAGSVRGLSSKSSSSAGSSMITIRPPIAKQDADEDEEEGVSTIKASEIPLTLKAKAPKQSPATIEEDFEDAFALPSELTKLSLAPLSLNHRSSKASLEWGEKDSTTSSQSSDAYSSLGFAENSPHSTSSASVSLPDTETDDEEDDLDGLVIPNALFESKQGVRQLNTILATKKKLDPASTQVKVAKLNPEDDFEAGLIIEDDVDLSPSRLLNTSQNGKRNRTTRAYSIPPPKTSTLRPPSRARLERSKSPSNPPPSSQRQLQKIRSSPPRSRPSSRSQTYQPFPGPPPIPSPTPSPSSSFLTPKPGSLRGQKSHSGLKPPTPPATSRLTRKASLSVIETSQKQTSRTSTDGNNQPGPSRYEAPTVASRAKVNKGSISRLSDAFKVPPTRPTTPSSNTAALRLTMPTQSRLKSRPALSSVFAGLSPEPPATPMTPLPRPPSSTALRPASRNTVKPPQPPSTPPAPTILKKPAKARAYGDGSELDAFDDLPLNTDKEGRFRVHPKSQSNRIPASSYDKPSSKTGADKAEGMKGTIRRSKRDISNVNESGVLVPSTNSLRRTSSILDSRSSSVKPNSLSEPLPKKKKNASSPSTRRKPTLIRNLGGAGNPKVVGDMKWNPSSLRWEGNDSVLREFDSALGTSTRPALITQLTGSALGSPAGGLSNGARVVGNMYFDPQQMRWISTLPPDEEEPDVFANLADDEEGSDVWERKSGTIRAMAHGPRTSDASSITSGSESLDGMTPSPSPSPVHGHSRTISDSGSDDRGSRASMYMGEVDEEFAEKCRLAEARHRNEMRGWRSNSNPNTVYAHLHEIRQIATRASS